MRAKPLFVAIAVSGVGWASWVSAQEMIKPEPRSEFGEPGDTRSLRLSPSKESEELNQRNKMNFDYLEGGQTVPTEDAKLHEAIREAKPTDGYVSEEDIKELSEDLVDKKIQSLPDAESEVSDWLLDALRKAAKERNSPVTIELLSGDITVDATMDVGKVKITGGKFNLYKLAKNVVIACGLMDVALATKQSTSEKHPPSDICLKKIFGQVSL